MEIFEFLTGTMVMERLLGVLTYGIALAFACNAVSICRRSRVKLWLMLYCIILTVMAFFYIPGVSADLTRLTGYMREWAQLDFAEILEICKENESPLVPLYYWVIGQAGIDGLLPAVTAFIGFTCIFSCLWDYARRADCNQGSLAIALAFVMSVGFFVGLISGIRNGLAYCLIVRCFYTEEYARRNPLLNTPLYLVAALLHAAGMAMVLLRLVVLPFGAGRDIRSKVVCFILVFAGVVYMAFSWQEYMQSLVEKGMGYVGGDSYADIWEFLNHFILLAVLLYSAVVSRGLSHGRRGFSASRRLIAILCVLSLCSIPLSHTLFARMSMMAILLSPVYLIQLLDNPAFIQRAPRFVSYLKGAIALSLVISCLRGNLSGYKYLLIS